MNQHLLIFLRNQFLDVLSNWKLLYVQIHKRHFLIYPYALIANFYSLMKAFNFLLFYKHLGYNTESYATNILVQFQSNTDTIKVYIKM